MALVLSKANILTGNTIQAADVSQSIDAFTGLIAYDLTITGSLNATGSVITGSISNATNAVTSSVSLGLKTQNANSNQSFRIPFISETGLPTIGSSDIVYKSILVDSGSDGSGLSYNPSNNSLTASYFNGTASYASLANTASYIAVAASTNALNGVIVPSGSIPVSTNLNFIAGATQTDNSPTPSAIVTLPGLVGKILGQTCFVTIGVTGSAAGDLVTVAGLVGPNLTFESQNANTDFYYHIIYT